MSTIKRDVTEELIHAFVDGQLSPDEQIRFERILENDLSLQEKVGSYQKQNLALHNLFDPVLDEPIPERVSIQVREKKSGRFFAIAAGLLLFCSGGVSGWLVNQQQILPQLSFESYRSVAQIATVAHKVYVPEVKHPVEVLANQEQHLIKWLSKRMGENIKPPALEAFGYGLIGGRLLPDKSGPAAQFMYESDDGKRVTLYVRKKTHKEKNTAFRFYKENDVSSFYWIDGDLGYAIVGDVNRKQLLDTANAVYQQLSL